MIELFEPNAQYREISGNSLLLLNRPETFYLVASENVDVFSVPVQDGQPSGTRIHLFRAEQGSLLLGLDPEGYGTGLGLVVSGKPGSYVLEVSRPEIGKASAHPDPHVRQQMRTLIRGWIDNLTTSLAQGIPPKDTIHLIPETWQLQSGQHVKTKSEYKLLWTRHLQGKSTFFSYLPIQEGTVFPLAEQAWLTAQTDCSLECISEQAYQEQDPGYEAIASFHSHYFAFLQHQLQARQEQERKRQAKMIDNDQRQLSSILSRLGDTMDLRPKSIAPPPTPGDNLLTACQRVGEHLGVQVHEPPKEAQINTDPLMAIAKGSRLRIRQVTLQDGWWKSDSGPMLGYLIDPETEKQHPVALLQISAQKYVLEDPRDGSRRKMTKELNEQLSFFGYVLYRPLPNRPLKAMDLLRQGLHGVRKDQRTLTLMSILGALLALFPPIATGVIFDTMIPEANRFGLLYIGAILFSAAVGKGLFEVTKSVAIMRMVGRIDATLQAGVMDRLLSLPTAFFRNYTAGDLAERTLGINAIRETLSGVTLETLLTGIFSIFSLALLFYYTWRLALVALGITLIAAMIVAGIGYLQVRYQRQIQYLQGELSGLVLQLITGIAKLRVSGTEDRAFATWAEKFRSMRRSTFQARNLSNHLEAFTKTLPVLSLLILFSWIVFTPLLEKISVGSIIAFNSAFTQFQFSLVQMAMSLVSSLKVIPLYERAQPIIKTHPEVDEDKAGPGELTGDLEVNNISFRYDPDGPLILEDVSLQVQAGEFVALVGGSGSGKSTLLRLLLGFETPEAGTIYYDGQDLAGLDVTAVRRQLGVVLQNGSLMAGDIFTNIVGSSRLTLDDAWEAARMAGLEQDIKNMPMGMHTMIPEGGGTLSGGQQQRLLIARAIVHKPRILFFDEATSALDNTTQRQVSESLEKLNSTRIVIAHRLSTIMHADTIFVLDKGRMVQQGTYAELIEQPGLFADLAKRQLT